MKKKKNGKPSGEALRESSDTLFLATGAERIAFLFFLHCAVTIPLIGVILENRVGSFEFWLLLVLVTLLTFPAASAVLLGVLHALPEQQRRSSSVRFARDYSLFALFAELIIFFPIPSAPVIYFAIFSIQLVLIIFLLCTLRSRPFLWLALGLPFLSTIYFISKTLENISTAC